jgi:hypothetical protein
MKKGLGDYVIGLDRNDEHLVAHLYDGDLSDPGQPMCARGWNRSNGFGYSIFRNNVGDAGICSICMRRALAGLPSVPPRERKTRWI